MMMLDAFAVFVPWLALALLIALVLCAADLVSRVRAWAHWRRSFRAACRGQARTYCATFINNRGY